MAFVEAAPEATSCARSSTRSASGDSEGSWENFLYFVARDYWTPRVRRAAERRPRSSVRRYPPAHPRRLCACRRRSSRSATLDPRELDPRLGDVDAEALAQSHAAIVNIDYPLGLAAYNILREVAVDSSALRGVYVLGKAATLTLTSAT